jgi:hypothetical protein
MVYQTISNHLRRILRGLVPRSLIVRVALAGLVTLFVWAPLQAPVPHLSIESHRGPAPHLQSARPSP